MEPFEPGADYGRPYEVFLFVCTNPVARTFEKCAVDQGHQVLKALQHAVMTHGLGKRVFVFQSGCMLGCQEKGTTVMQVHLAVGGIKSWRGVTPDHVEAIMETVRTACGPNPESGSDAYR